ncbi:hypothetical protein L1987_25891 [Smallanthus sonchifolius]|uniref:Uncharacterized protein n=1 Tax=Smallanthus sonchifolius TaxID=185202 RepID=A0ACB9I9B8_9ASTR|nr:hypothetical protein L1987_25891 [Smallanthus sonchifolius]
MGLIISWWPIDETSGAVRHQSAHSSFTYSLNPIVIITHRPPIYPHFAFIYSTPLTKISPLTSSANTTTTTSLPPLATTLQPPLSIN